VTLGWCHLTWFAPGGFWLVPRGHLCKLPSGHAGKHKCACGAARDR
jgi:hypothetical protein